jgi:hypothetical protein
MDGRQMAGGGGANCSAPQCAGQRRQQRRGGTSVRRADERQTRRFPREQSGRHKATRSLLVKFPSRAALFGGGFHGLSENMAQQRGHQDPRTTIAARPPGCDRILSSPWVRSRHIRLVEQWHGPSVPSQTCAIDRIARTYRRPARTFSIGDGATFSGNEVAGDGASGRYRAAAASHPEYRPLPSGW